MVFPSFLFHTGIDLRVNYDLRLEKLNPQD